MLDSWTDLDTRKTIEEFVFRVTDASSPQWLPPAERVAVFDNDGTLWCEKPMPVELGCILKRMAAMAETDPALRARQPWKAAYEKDYGWLGSVITKHYLGDDNDVKVLMAGVLGAFRDMSVEEYARAARSFLDSAQHPAFHRRLRDCAYAPMIELLRYLEQHGFTSYIASGGDRDFMRVIAEEIYGIPAERVIGSSTALCYRDDGDCGTVAYLAKPGVFDDGPAKPVRIWSRIGRRPIVAFGNSNGDIQMLQFAGGAGVPALRLLLLHDDASREVAYTAGAEKSLELAKAHGWTVVSMKSDWTTVFQS